MKRNVKICSPLLLSVFLFLPCSSLGDFSFSIPAYSVGLIYEEGKPRPIGTGFVFEDTRFVVTTYHVLVDERTNRRRQISFHTGKGLREKFEPAPPLRLKPYLLFEREDIAVLEVEGINPCKEPLMRGDFPALHVGSIVGYGGYDRREAAPTFMISGHPVRRIFEENGVRYLEIYGIAIPGFSGGPIFGGATSVVGVILRGRPAPDGSGSIFYAVSVEHIPSLLDTSKQ